MLPAIRNRNLEELTALIEAGEDVSQKDGDGETPLTTAAYGGHIECVELLLQQGADLEQRGGWYDLTPLHVASQYGQYSVVKLLLQKNANANATDRYRGTPLIMAASGGYFKIVKLLLNSGAQVEHQDIFGMTALHSAAGKGHYTTVEMLLKHGGLPNTTDIEQNTPLILAAMSGRIKTMKLLQSFGADTTLQNKRKKTANDFIKEIDVDNLKTDELSLDADKYIADNIDAYMRACVDGDAMIRRWRLMVLGPSGDGKTALINRLLGKGFTEEHIITNALETDCRVEITHCDREWKEYQADHLSLLDEGVTQCIRQSIKHQKADKPVKNSATVNRPNFVGPIKFDEILDTEEKDEAKARLETIFQNRSVLKSISRPAAPKKKRKDNAEKTSPSVEESGFLKFILSIWDLGGQVLYYTLHHIFLRWHCVYILVVNLSRPLDSYVPSHELPPHVRQKNMKYYQSLEFWLNMVFSHMVKVKNMVGLPRILLVGTHKDMLHTNPKEQERLAQEYFSKLQSRFLKKAHFQQVHSQFVAVDSKNGDPQNYAKLRTLILDLVERHCNQCRSRPIRWLRLEKKLHELQNDKSLNALDRNLVNYGAAMKYAKQFHIQTDEDLKFFLEFHHLTADITYCSGEGLEQYIVPRPQWLIDVLRSLITLDKFYPQSQKCIQEKNQLQQKGRLKTNSVLLNEVWKHFLRGKSSDAAKQYLLNLMEEFDLAVKYEENHYIIPCLLPICPSPDLPVFQGLVRNLPSLYFIFHSSVDSYIEVREGDDAYDNFLPHGLFQKLISKCSKQGWAWTKDRYQDSVSFSSDNVLISLQVKSTWIVLNVHAMNQGIAANYSRYQSTIATAIKQLFCQYHPNMWFEHAVNPCAKVKQECMLSIGSTSLDKGHPTLHGVTCSDHLCSLVTPQFHTWFSPSPSRVLTEKDLKRIGNELTDEWSQLNLASELDIPSNEINAINNDSHEIKLASFKILKYWYDQQMYKVDAFATLCNALKKSGQTALIEKCLNVSPDQMK